jgi:hypothetical protein
MRGRPSPCNVMASTASGTLQVRQKRFFRVWSSFDCSYDGVNFGEGGELVLSVAEFT